MSTPLVCSFVLILAACSTPSSSLPDDLGNPGAASGAQDGSTAGPGCGSTSASGTCDLDTRSYCQNNTIITVNCADTPGQTCVMTAGTATCAAKDSTANSNPGFTVGGPCNGLSAQGVCDAVQPNLWVLCGADGTITQIDCQMYGYSATCKQLDGGPTCAF